MTHGLLMISKGARQKRQICMTISRSIRRLLANSYATRIFCPPTFVKDAIASRRTYLKYELALQQTIPGVNT